MKNVGFVEIVTSPKDVNGTGHFTIARVVERNCCAELHYDEGIATIEFDFQIVPDAWENEELIEVNWFSPDMTDSEVITSLNDEFEMFFGAVLEEGDE